MRFSKHRSGILPGVVEDGRFPSCAIDVYQIYETAKADYPVNLLQQDRDRYTDPVDAALEMVGVDPADRAVSYAVDAGLLDAGVATNLENSEPTSQDVAAIENSDLIVSTGCVGYVTEISLERLLEAILDSRPWMAHSCCACSISVPRKKC